MKNDLSVEKKEREKFHHLPIREEVDSMNTVLLHTEESSPEREGEVGIAPKNRGVLVRAQIFLGTLVG